MCLCGIARAQIPSNRQSSLIYSSPSCTSDTTFSSIKQYQYGFGVPQLCYDYVLNEIYYWNGTGWTIFAGGSGFSPSTQVNGPIISGNTIVSPTNTWFAANYSGATADVKIASCLTAAAVASATPGTCDASGILGGTIAATITIPQGVTLKLGAGTYVATAAANPVFALTNINSTLEGAGYQYTNHPKQTIISVVANWAGVVTNGVVINVTAEGDAIENLAITGTHVLSDGTYCIDENGTNTLIANNNFTNCDTGIAISPTGAGSYYDRFENNAYSITGGTGVTQSELWGLNANQDLSLNERFAGTAYGAEFLSGAISDAVMHPDCESVSGETCIDIASNGVAVYDLYCEGVTNCVEFEATAFGNWVTGGGHASSVSAPIAYASGADKVSNVVTWYGAGTTPIYPQYWTAFNYLLSNTTTFDFYTTLPDPVGSGFLWILDEYTPGATPEVSAGLTGAAGRHVGNLKASGGLTPTGSIIGSQLSTPTGLTCTATCASACTTTYEYKVVCHDFNTYSLSLGSTVPSASATCSNNATLATGTNFNTLNWTKQSGCYKWDIIGNQDFTHSVTTNASVDIPGSVASPGANYQYVDFSNSPSAYTPPTRDSGGDWVSAGQLTIQTVAEGSLPATCTAGAMQMVSGASSTLGTCTSGSATVLAVCQASNVWLCL